MKKIKLLVLLTIMLIPLNIFAYEKEEYIYTNIDTQGKEIEKVINNELKLNYKGEVKDNSYLKDILNINGNEKFTTDENTLTWESKGKSILYSKQNTSQPVSPGKAFNNLIFNLFKHSLSLYRAFVELIADSKTLCKTYL